MTRGEKKYCFYMITGIFAVLAGGSHFFFFIFSDPKLFKLSAIGQIPSSLALTIVVIGGACVLRAWKIEDEESSRNRSVPYDKEMDPRVHF